METYTLNQDIKVFYIKATSYPEGILAAHQKLHSLVPFSLERKYFGISHPVENEEIIYRAATEETYLGEAEKYNCEKFVIPKGNYTSELLTNWRKDESIIQKTFQKLLAHPQIDPQGFCLEMYLNDNDMLCLVKLNT